MKLQGDRNRVFVCMCMREELKRDRDRVYVCMETDNKREREKGREGINIYLQVLTVFSLYILETHTLLLRIQMEAKNRYTY